MSNETYRRKRLYGVGIAALAAITGMIYWRRREQWQPIKSSEFTTNLKSNAYLQCYSWMRYYAPLLIANISTLSLLLLYKHSKYSTHSTPKQLKRYTFIPPSPPSYRHQPKITNYNTFWIHFSYNSWQFYLNDILLLASSLNVLFCICMDQMFNSDPFHPLMLFEKHVEYVFIDKYKKSVNVVVNNFINNNLDNAYLLDIIWQYITYDTRKSHMIIDVKFTNAELKHESFICRKYKAMLASQFKMYQQDMRFAYSISDKKCKKIQPNFEYFWKIKSFGFDFNVFTRDYLDTFKLKDSQQITQFVLWCIVNYVPIYVFKKWFKNEKSLLWKYGLIIICRESAFYAALVRITSIKWFCGGFLIIPYLIYQKHQQTRAVVEKRKKPKQVAEKIKTIARESEPEVDWFWASDKLI